MAEFKKPVETRSPLGPASSTPPGAGRGDPGDRRGEPGSGSLRRTQWSNTAPDAGPDEGAGQPVRKGASPLVLTVAGLAALIIVAAVIGSMVWVISASHSAGPQAGSAPSGRATLVGVPVGTGRLVAISPDPGADSNAAGSDPAGSDAAASAKPGATVSPSPVPAGQPSAAARPGNTAAAVGAAASAAKTTASAKSSATASAATYESLPGTWPQCAAENANCSFSGTKVVAFGADGEFNYALATGTIACNDATFSDPVYFTVKACYAQAVAPTDDVWSACASENGTCAFSGIMTVAFGANGSYHYATLRGGTACSDSVFGDPAYGSAKTCYLMGSPPEFTSWKSCAGENGTCSFSGTHEVAFGSAGRYFYGSFTGSAPCDSAVFGDPNLFVAKACYVQ